MERRNETAEAVEFTAEAADAHDEALLDMIAMEMGAPDPFDDDEIVEPAVAEAHVAEPVVEDADIAEPVVEEAHFAEPPAVEPEIVAELPEPMAAPVAPPVQHRLSRSPQPRRNRRWKSRSAHRSSRAASCAGPLRPMIRWPRSGA